MHFQEIKNILFPYFSCTQGVCAYIDATLLPYHMKKRPNLNQKKEGSQLSQLLIITQTGEALVRKGSGSGGSGLSQNR